MAVSWGYGDCLFGLLVAGVWFVAVLAYVGRMAMETEACWREDGEWFKRVEDEGPVETEVWCMVSMKDN
jgi:hypothetical protein